MVEIVHDLSFFLIFGIVATNKQLPFLLTNDIPYVYHIDEKIWNFNQKKVQKKPKKSQFQIDAYHFRSLFCVVFFPCCESAKKKISRFVYSLFVWWPLPAYRRAIFCFHFILSTFSMFFLHLHLTICICIIIIVITILCCFIYFRFLFVCVKSCL